MLCTLQERCIEDHVNLALIHFQVAIGKMVMKKGDPTKIKHAKHKVVTVESDVKLILTNFFLLNIIDNLSFSP